MAYGLPDPDGKALPVAALTPLSATHEAQLLEYLQNTIGDSRSVHLWHPPQTKLSQPPKRPGDYLDNKANIYSAAALAYRAGFTGLLVADALTARQLKADLRPGEDPILSVVIVRIMATGKDGNDHFRVIVKRRTTGDEKKKNIAEVLDTIKVSRSFAPNSYREERDRFSKYGLELQDPDRMVFSPNMRDSTGREEHEMAVVAAMEASTPLPVELTSTIASSLDHHKPPHSLPDWVQEELLTIFLAFPSTKDQRQHLQSALQSEIDRIREKEQAKDLETETKDLPVQVVPWEYDQPPTRHDIERHWEEIDGEAFSPVAYMLAPGPFTGDGALLEHAQFGSVHCSSDVSLFITRTTLAQIVKEHLSKPKSFKKALEIQEKLGDNLVVDPNEIECFTASGDPFYYNPPPWVPVSDVRRTMTVVSVFYLTNGLSEDQVQALKTEAHRPEQYMDRKGCCFVPWQHGDPDAPDGTLDDIWKIFWDMEQADDPPAFPIFFVDEQSGADRTVLMVEGARTYSDQFEEYNELVKDIDHPRLKGMNYGRVQAKDMHMAFVNLDIVNMSFEEWPAMSTGDETHLLPRADWPLHGILDD